MEYGEYLTQVIEQGIAAATESYKNSEAKLRGSIAGFNACRGKNPKELKTLLAEAGNVRLDVAIRLQAMEATGDMYWEIRCYESEIEWVCNVVSAALYNQGLAPIVIGQPTARAMMKAAQILGVKKVDAAFAT